MTRMPSFRALLAASVCLLPMQALAQNTSSFDVDDKPAAEPAGPPTNNWFTLGAQYNSTRSFYLGRYSGNVDPGFSALGSFRYGQRDAWDSGGTNYFELQGENLGFWDRSFSAKVGQQGSWGLYFNYDGIPYNATNSFKSVWQGNGLVVPGVAPGGLGVTWAVVTPRVGAVLPLWVPNATNSPLGKMFTFDLGTRRDIYSGGGKFQYGDWLITAGWRHEHKEGTLSSSLEIGGSPAVYTSSAAAPTFTAALGYFAQPIDYDMDRYDVSAAYSTPRLQTQVGYTYSHFENNAGAFFAQNPFAFTPNTSFGGSVANVTGIIAGPPSNSAHQLKGQFGYNITPTTRLNVNLGYGVQLQNAAFVQGTGNSNLAAQILPRSSFDGVMQTYFANAALTAQPMRDLGIRVSYTYDGRDNQSPQNRYTVYPRSSTSTQLYMNVPFNYQNQALSAEASYRLWGRTKLTLNDTLSLTSRTASTTSQVITNRVTAKIRTQLSDAVGGTLSVAHESRDVQNYNALRFYQIAGAAETMPSSFLMFFEASRKHDEVKAMVDFQPTNNVMLSLTGKMSRDNFPASHLGLRNNTNITVGPDASWQVSKDVNLHAYYTYQKLFFNQSNIYTGGAGATAFNVPWNMTSTDDVHTFGANADWQATEDLKVSLDYNLSVGNTAYAFGEGLVAYGAGITSAATIAGITMQPLPDVRAMLSVVSLHGEYMLRPNMTVLFGYAFERFTYKDFMNGQGATQFSNAYLPGTLSPNASVHIVSAALRVKF